MSAELLATPVPSAPPRRRWLGLAALLCVAVQLPGSLPLSAAALALWLAVLSLFDRPSLSRLWLPRFWLVTLIFALASGVLLGPKGQGALGRWVSREGLEAGLLMVVRGAFIFGLAIWASRALGGEDLRRLTRRLGVPRLGAALSVALELLPELKDRLVSLHGRGGQRWRGLYRLAVQAVRETDALARRLASGAGPALVAIVGPPGSGKTTLLGELCARLRERGLSLGGVTQPGLDQDGRREGYQLRDAATGELHPLARRRSEARAPGKLGYEFDPEAWSWAGARIRAARAAAEVLVVDELGRLEADGEGHLPALCEELASARARVHLLAVRADCASAIEERLGRRFGTVRVVDAEAPSLDALVESIAKQCLESQLEEGETP